MKRREFLQTAMAAMGSCGLLQSQLWAFQPVSVENPLGVYPDRDWERLYAINIAWTNRSPGSALRTTRTTAA